MRVTKEVKQFLRGNTYIDGDIVCVIENPKDAILNWKGITNGSFTTFTLGVASRKEIYDVPQGNDLFGQLKYFAGKFFIRVGRLAAIESNKDTIGCMAKAGMGNTVLYTVEKNPSGDHSLMVTAFTSKGALSQATLSRAFANLDKSIDPDSGFVRRILTKEDRYELKNEKKESKAKHKAADKEKAHLHKITKR